MLEYVSDRLKDDRDVVLATISENSGALKYASDKLKNDKDIVFIATSKNRDDYL